MPKKVFIDRDELLRRAKGTDAYFQLKSIVSGMRTVTAFTKDCDNCDLREVCKAREGAETERDYFTPEEVRSMSPREVRNNIEKIRKSMKMWR